MVIGKGLIGNKFTSLQCDQVLIFASGVSNSKSAQREDFFREIDLVRKTRRKYEDKLFVYFSTYSIDDPDLQYSPYVLHKKHVEEIICDSPGDYLIIRTSNIVGRNLHNPNTVLNFLFNKIQSGERFDCWRKAERNLLDIDHLYLMVDYILKSGLRNQIIYLVNPVNYSVTEIIETISSLLQKETNHNSVDKGRKFDFDKKLSKAIFEHLGLNTQEYLKDLIVKYYFDESR